MQVTPARSNGGYQSDDDRFDAPSEVKRLLNIVFVVAFFFFLWK